MKEQQLKDYFPESANPKYDMDIIDSMKSGSWIAKECEGITITYYVNYNYILSCWLWVEKMSGEPDYKYWLK